MLRVLRVGPQQHRLLGHCFFLGWRNMLLIVGKIYLIVGGDIMRYHGTLKGGRVLAFQDVKHGLSDPPQGSAVDPKHVLKRISAEDIGWLKARQRSAAFRDLHGEVQMIERVLSELKNDH